MRGVDADREARYRAWPSALSLQRGEGPLPSLRPPEEAWVDAVPCATPPLCFWSSSRGRPPVTRLLAGRSRGGLEGGSRGPLGSRRARPPQRRARRPPRWACAGPGRARGCLGPRRGCGRCRLATGARALAIGWAQRRRGRRPMGWRLVIREGIGGVPRSASGCGEGSAPRRLPAGGCARRPLLPPLGPSPLGGGLPSGLGAAPAATRPLWGEPAWRPCPGPGWSRAASGRSRPRHGFRWGSAGAGAEVRGEGGRVGAGGRALPCPALPGGLCLGRRCLSPGSGRPSGGRAAPGSGRGCGQPLRCAALGPAPPLPSHWLVPARLREASGGNCRREARAELPLGGGGGSFGEDGRVSQGLVRREWRGEKGAFMAEAGGGQPACGPGACARPCREEPAR